MRDHIFSRASSLREHPSKSVQPLLTNRFNLSRSLKLPPTNRGLSPLPPHQPANVEKVEKKKIILLLPDSLSRLVKSIAANNTNGEEIVRRAETPRGEVALFWFRSARLMMMMMRSMERAGDKGSVPCIERAHSRRLGGGLGPLLLWRTWVLRLRGDCDAGGLP